jgi:hypothetical protein
MPMSRHKNTGHDHNIKTANRSSENVAKFSYLGMRLTNPNCIREEIKKISGECLLPFSSESVFLPVT